LKHETGFRAEEVYMHAYTHRLNRLDTETRSFGDPDGRADFAPPSAPLAMPEQPLRDAAQPRRFAQVPGLARRRAALAAFCILSTALAVFAVTAALGRDGLEPLEVAHAGLILVLFGWMAFSFAASLGGLWLSGQADAWEREVLQAPLSRLRTRTALLAPIYHEEVGPFFARLETMRAGLHALGLTPAFDIVVLSDSRRAEVVAEEQRGFTAFRRGAGPRAYYRHRLENTDRKAGNIADWVRRHGGAYDHMVVLDADSLMDGQTLWRLAAILEREPTLGLVQTAPTIIGRRTVFGRLEQFANTLYGPLAAWGVAWWSGADGNYWGHNAILRVEAFAQSSGLPHLKGRKPFGGHIMSHDFVEAAFLRRAGWGVRMIPDLNADTAGGGSFEESPPTLIDHLIRDRRWCQGNLQHLGVVAARGLHPVSRLHLARGVLSYALSPLWIALVVTGALLSAPDAVDGDPGGYPLAGAVVLGVSLVFVLAPKLLSYAMMLRAGQAHRFGGAGRALASVGLETLASTLTAPVIMAVHTRALLAVTLGRDAGWSAQQRAEGRLGGKTALAFHWPEMLVGAALAALGPAMGAGLSPWLAVAAASLVAAPFLSWWTASPSRGLRMRDAGLLLTPGETSRRRAWSQPAGVNSFNPNMPETISARQTSRPAVAGSLNTRMPTMAVPTAPTPVQTA
jgi:membrane glycosyltransferase